MSRRICDQRYREPLGQPSTRRLDRRWLLSATSDHLPWRSPPLPLRALCISAAARGRNRLPAGSRAPCVGALSFVRDATSPFQNVSQSRERCADVRARVRWLLLFRYPYKNVGVRRARRDRRRQLGSKACRARPQHIACTTPRGSEGTTSATNGSNV